MRLLPIKCLIIFDYWSRQTLLIPRNTEASGKLIRSVRADLLAAGAHRQQVANVEQLSGFQLPPLRDYGVEQVFPPLDQSRDAVPSQLAPQFIHIIRSVLANFLEVTNILSMDPEKAPDKLEDLRVLLLNAHRVLNEYRPHHARETLIHLMQQRVDGLQKQIRDVTDMEAQVDDVLASLGIVDDEHSTQTADGMSRIERAEQQKEADRAQHMWTALDNIELG